MSGKIVEVFVDDDRDVDSLLIDTMMSKVPIRDIVRFIKELNVQCFEPAVWKHLVDGRIQVRDCECRVLIPIEDVATNPDKTQKLAKAVRLWDACGRWFFEGPADKTGGAPVYFLTLKSQKVLGHRWMGELGELTLYGFNGMNVADIVMVRKASEETETYVKLGTLLNRATWKDFLNAIA